ncbi:MAG TPA: alpha/beta hydrolase [Verrucomicrobiae bacterium]
MKTRAQVFGIIFVAAAALILLASCTITRPLSPNKPCRTGQPPGGIQSAIVESNSLYSLGFVEFDDQGWYWGYRQWETAVKPMIESAAAESPNGVLMLVFVHGWKNNAQYDNSNVAMMRGILADLAEDEQAGSHRKVVGVYVGWRGLSAEWEPFKEISFYERKAVAERVGHGSATQLFAELDALQDKLNKGKSEAQHSDLILVGHSFGGALLFSAVTQILTERLASHLVEDTNIVRSVGDMVILVNPAFEAARYQNLFREGNAVGYQAEQKPVLSIFTSAADSATGFWFPVGRYFGTRFERVRGNANYFQPGQKSSGPSQGKAILDSVGHFRPYLTHDLIYTNLSTNQPQGAALSTLAAIETNSTRAVHFRTDGGARARTATNTISYWFQGTQPGAAYLLQSRAGYRDPNPFLNVAVDKQIIRDHDDINNTNFVKFLKDYIVFWKTKVSP